MLQSKVARQVQRTGSQARFPRTGCSCSQEQLQARFEARTDRIPSKVPKDRFRKKVPNVTKNRFPSKVPMNRFEESRQSFQDQVIRIGSQEQVPKNRFPSKVPMNKCQATFPRTVAQARFQEQWTTECCKVWRNVLITERRNWRISFASKNDTALAHGLKTLDESVAWKKAGGRRQEDKTQEKWRWWWWWWRSWWWRQWRWRWQWRMNDDGDDDEW